MLCRPKDSLRFDLTAEDEWKSMSTRSYLDGNSDV